MANVLNKSTFQYMRSVNTPDYMDGEWLINPDMDNVYGVEQKYWKVLNDDIAEMTQGEKDVVDGNLLPAYKVAKKTELKTIIKSFIESKFNAEEQRTLFHLVSEAKADGKTNRFNYLLPYWTWVKAAITFKHNKNDAIAAATDIATVNSVCDLNWTALEASVPSVSIRDALAIAD